MNYTPHTFKIDFIIKQVFRKKAVFSEKIVKNHLWEDMTDLGGGGRRHLITKINTTFFVRSKVLNIFHLSIFPPK